MIAVAFSALWWGGWIFFILVAVGGILMLYEWANLVGATPGQRRLAQYALTVPIALMSPAAAGPGFLALGFVFGAMFFVGAVTRHSRLAWGVLYVGIPVLSLVALRNQPDAVDPSGFLLTLWAMALVWACDSGAYFAGRAIGGPKLAPSISPNKTWAGFFGGVAAAGLFGAVLAIWFHLPVALAVATPFLAMLAQVGDLYESHLKRVAGVKDSGTMLPGHGGLLDRLDGLVAVAPVAALLVVLLLR